MWRNQRWIGTYKMYYTNDSVRQIIHYDSLGKKTGLHEEYYSDGKLMLKTNYTNGYANGWRTFYNDSGRVYKREFYSYDIIDTTQTKIYPPVPISPETNSLRRDNPYIGIPEHGQVAITGNWKSQDSLQKLAPDDTIFHYVNSALRPLNCDCDTTSLQRGSLNHQEALTGKEGYWILFQNGQIRMKGFFHLYKLVCGVNCVYDANGQLIQIKKYKDGKYIGDAPLPADANK
jgi:antitoxin component YwqK of YwqJK toxin-antitoxin module